MAERQGEKERERGVKEGWEGERVPRNYARVSYSDTSTAVTATGPNDFEWVLSIDDSV